MELEIGSIAELEGIHTDTVSILVLCSFFGVAVVPGATISHLAYQL
jgi:hypothetical protein